MSAGNCPETPRQKMIGMMYLVLTALLALNVSKEVLTAFVKIDESISRTTLNFSAKTRSLYAKIDAKAIEQPGKYTTLAKQAHDIEKQSNKFFSDIDRLKVMIKQTGEGPEATLDSPIKKLDNLDAASITMIGEGGKMMGDSLRMWMENYRKVILTVVGDTSSSVYKTIDNTLAIVDQLNDPAEPKTWQMTFCKGMPMIGTIALLSKLQARSEEHTSELQSQR